MRAAVFSDSHGNTANMVRAVRDSLPDCVVHLGDCTPDAESVSRLFPGIPFHIVRGNCDPGSPHPDSILLELDGVKIFAAHGHRYGVKTGLQSLCNSAGFSGASICLFGHTHSPILRDMDGLLLMNPGSVGDALRPTYGQIELNNGKFACKIVEISL